MVYRAVRWKRNFNKVPPGVRAALDEVATDLVVVAATKKIARDDIEAGAYEYLNMRVEEGRIICGGAALPPPDMGKWSERNAFGWDRKRTDWPMVDKAYVFETPNFGDAATYGTHMHIWTREVYQHQVFEPQGMTISTDVLQDRGDDHVVVKFSVDPLLAKDQPEFELMLLWALNVLQENTGVTGVFPANADRQAFLGTIQLDWQVFPPGTIEEVIARLRGAPPNARNAPHFDSHVWERVVLFNRLNPRAYLRGQGGFGSYFGAQFDDDLVVFENLKYGNALYLLYENWDEISRRSRLDLLRDHDASFDRIVHTEDWEERFTALLREKLNERRRGRRR